ncbi:DNA repair and recombination protein RAD26, partial [Trifolium medium]|nr:DNA repair and recombination protein RAD26 [Trifolium medium]
IEFEIGAVSSTIQRPRDVDKGEENGDVGEENENAEEGIGEGGGSELQRALAADSLVKEDRRPKKKLKDDKKLSKRPAKRFKTVSFDDDADFDAVLDAASAGFVETVSYANCCY